MCMDTNNALQKAIDCLGNQRKLAAALGVKPQAVTNWKQSGVPVKQALKIQRATGGAVQCHELCPDDFPVPAEAA